MVAVDIANLALSYLGDTATVASLDPPQGSAQAQHCARFYPIALSVMLDAHQWNFATTRVALAQVANYVSVDNRWQYAYALPSDVSNVISVLPQWWYPTPDTTNSDYLAFDAAIADYYGWGYWPLDWELEQCGNFPFQIEVLSGQPVVMTNVCQAVARYSSNTVQPGQFPAQFTDALAWKLASMLAGPLIKGDAGAKMGEMCLAMHEKQMGKAMMIDSNQRNGNRPVAPAGIVARNGCAWWGR